MQVSKALKAFSKLASDERQSIMQQHQADITGIVATMSTTVQACSWPSTADMRSQGLGHVAVLDSLPRLKPNG